MNTLCIILIVLNIRSIVTHSNETTIRTKRKPIKIFHIPYHLSFAPSTLLLNSDILKWLTFLLLTSNVPQHNNIPILDTFKNKYTIRNQFIRNLDPPEQDRPKKILILIALHCNPLLTY